MKLFIRTSALADGAPVVLASYPSDSPITANAHGPDLTMLDIPNVQLVRLPNETFPRLPEGWREQLSTVVSEFEADKRIKDVFPPSSQMSAMHELINLIFQYGTDVLLWPEIAKSRKADLDEAWNYVRDVRARAQAMKSLPVNFTADEHWPARIAKK